MLQVNSTVEKVIGFKVAGLHVGLKKDPAAPDMALIVSDRPCVAAGMFTRNQAKAAPILVSQEHLQAQASQIRAVVVNTSSANAMTGRAGLENARTVTRWVAQHLGCAHTQVLPMSTGVIGAHLPMPKMELGVPKLVHALGEDWQAAARGIMTTDTRPKIASVRVMTPNGNYTIAGISKGAGMIAPNMATMLGVIVTDAGMALTTAQNALKAANEISFNRIVVDGDTSTNDCAFLLANGASGVIIDTPTEYAQFLQALSAVMITLAQAIVRDGEGATKFITLHVTGAAKADDAHRIAHTVAASPLVKTAFYGGDANWGRIIAAAGRSGAPFEPEKAQLWMTAGEKLTDGRGLQLFKDGMPTTYSEAEATAIFKHTSVYVSLDLGLGDASAMVWTCDLSHAYVDINADYRS